MIEELKAFVAVVEEQSITKAAECLHLTQSAVSRRLQQLESSLDVTLLDRSSRPPSPTLLGMRVYEHALTVIRNVDGLMLLAREDAEPAGTLRLGVSHALSEAISLPAVQGLAAKFPDVDVRLKTGWSAALKSSVDSQELDAAIALFGKGAIRASDEAQRIGSIEIVVIQSRRHPIVPRKVRIEELAAHNWVLNPLGCGYRAELERQLRVSGQQLRVAVDTHGAELQLNMIASGVGLGLAPSLLVRSSTFRDELDILHVAGFSLDLEVWVLRPMEIGNMSRAITLVSRLAGSLLVDA